MKRTIKLTESDLHRIVKESVGKVISENYKDNDFLVHSVPQEVFIYCGLYDVIHRLENLTGSDAYAQFAHHLKNSLKRFMSNFEHGKPRNKIDQRYTTQDLINMRRDRVRSAYPDKSDDEIDDINHNHFFTPLRGDRYTS